MFGSDLFWHTLYRPRAIGLENIPKTGGVLVASNHVSNFEPMFIGYWTINSFSRFSSRKIWSPGKEELFKFPPLRWILRSWRAFPVRRNQRDFKTMSFISELAKKDVVMIYPEGTRSKDGKLQPGKPAVGKIIYDSRTTVVPTAVFNMQYCMPRGAKFPRFFLPLAVVFGKPLDLSKYYGLPDCRENSQAIIDEVMGAIAAIQKEYAHLDIYHEGEK